MGHLHDINIGLEFTSIEEIIKKIEYYNNNLERKEGINYQLSIIRKDLISSTNIIQTIKANFEKNVIGLYGSSIGPKTSCLLGIFIL